MNKWIELLKSKEGASSLEIMIWMLICLVLSGIMGYAPIGGDAGELLSILFRPLFFIYLIILILAILVTNFDDIVYKLKEKKEKSKKNTCSNCKYYIESTKNSNNKISLDKK